MRADPIDGSHTQEKQTKSHAVVELASGAVLLKSFLRRGDPLRDPVAHATNGPGNPHAFTRVFAFQTSGLQPGSWSAMLQHANCGQLHTGQAKFQSNFYRTR